VLTVMPVHALVPALMLIASAAFAADPAPSPAPPGDPKTSKTSILEAGAKSLQSRAPLAGFDIYLDGFHALKDDPSSQMEAHHYCKQVNEDFAQCVLFDGNTRAANLTGVEYIISEKLFDSLPLDERKLWHPHNYEILSGELIAPSLPDKAEHALMRRKINSYGKTWHFWPSSLFGKPEQKLPVGAAMLAWSFNRDGEVAPGLMQQRNQRMKVDMAQKRRNRADLPPMAHPQQGVDEMKDKFGRPTQDLPGVRDINAK